MQNHEGGCLCGRVRFRVNGPPLDTGYCHCRMCQKNSGAPVVAWATFGASSFAWIQGRPGIYESSPAARRHFCTHCGSYMVFQREDRPQEISVNTASFDEPNAFPPRTHIFTESQVQWLRIDDVLPRQIGYGTQETKEC